MMILWTIAALFLVIFLYLFVFPWIVKWIVLTRVQRMLRKIRRRNKNDEIIRRLDDIIDAISKAKR